MKTHRISNLAASTLGALLTAGLLLNAHCSAAGDAPGSVGGIDGAAGGTEGALRARAADDPDPAPPIELCADRSDRLCAFLPKDNLFKSSFPAYRVLNAVDERTFDNYGWQTFVALNWPANADGTPSAESIASPSESQRASRRVWESYATLTDVFGPPRGEPAACKGVGHGEEVMDLNFLQVGDLPLIDQNGNFVLYDVRMNPVEVDYIRKNGLDTRAGQEAFAAANKKVKFPVGHYADDATRTGGEDPAIEIKSGWRLLDDGKDDASRYFTIQRRVFVPAAATADKKDMCFAAKLGMISFHVMAKTTTDPQPQHWMWPSFEHVDNAPLAAAPTPQTEESLGACEAPRDVARAFSFFDPRCASSGADCTPNREPDASVDFLWASAPPYARAYPKGQVVRCWGDFAETEEVTAAYQAALGASPLRFYRMVATQWDAKVDSYQGDPLPVPRKMSNDVMETYDQDSSCLGCHKRAHTSALDDTDFSFLLRHAK